MVKIKIGSEYIDTLPDFDIGLIVAPNSFAELETRSGIESFDITIPGSNKNRNIIPEPGQRALVEIEKDGATFDALLVVNEFNSYSNEYACNILAGQFFWLESIRDKTLKDLDLSRYNHVYSLTEYLQSFDNSEGFIYAPVNPGYLPAMEIDINFQFPSIYASTILKQIFTDAGFNIEGTLLSNSLFNSLALPFSNQVNRTFREFIVQSQFEESVSSITILEEIDLSTFIEGESPEIDIDNNTLTNNGISSVTWSINALMNILLRNTSGASVNVRFGYEIDGGATVWTAYALVNPGPQITVPYNVNIFLEPGQSVKFFAEYVPGLGGNIILRIWELNFQERFLFVPGALITIQDVLPEITQADFLRYIFFSFGVLTSYEESTKTVILDQFTDLQKNIAIDKTQDVNIEGGVRIVANQELSKYAKVNRVIYQNDSADELLQSFEEDTNSSFGSGQFDCNIVGIEPEKDFISFPFAGTFMKEAPVLSDAAGFYLPYIPIFQDEFTRQAVTPRVLIVKRNVPVNTFTSTDLVSVTDGTDTETVTEMPFAYFHKARRNNLIDSFTDSLAFSQQQLVNNPFQETISETTFSPIQNILFAPNIIRIIIKFSTYELLSYRYSFALKLNFGAYVGNYLVSSVEGTNQRNYYLVTLVKI